MIIAINEQRLAIDHHVPALHERALQEWTQVRDADRARAEAMLAAQGPAVRPSTADPDGLASPRPPDRHEDDGAADLEALEKLEDLHRSGALSDDEFAAATRSLAGE